MSLGLFPTLCPLLPWPLRSPRVSFYLHSLSHKTNQIMIPVELVSTLYPGMKGGLNIWSLSVLSTLKGTTNPQKGLCWSSLDVSQQPFLWLSCVPVFVCVCVFVSLLRRLSYSLFFFFFVFLLQWGCLWPVTSQNFSEHSTFRFGSVSLGADQVPQPSPNFPPLWWSGSFPELSMAFWVGAPCPPSWATSVHTCLDFDRAWAKAWTPAVYTFCEEDCGLFFLFFFFF